LGMAMFGVQATWARVRWGFVASVPPVGKEVLTLSILL
jgi:hypothetical protein